MSDTNYTAFFKTATGGSHSPYDYQSRLACGERDAKSDAEWLSSGNDYHSRLINIPTGLGKTAAVVLAWMWNRVVRNDPAWPRRLVYCLPMRTLVEQTAGEVKKWINAILADEKGGLALGNEIKAKLKWLAANSPVVLMGGEDAGEWDLHPEREAILIGTQDMLLSRALNRGYGMSRYRWPMHFGLLNSDALWVMDETQLMGPALWTSAQLDWMRHDRFRSLFPAPTWWMSATVGDEFLKTSDRTGSKFPMPEIFELGNEPNAARKLAARRPCAMWTEPASPKMKVPAKGKAAATNLGGGFSHSLAAAVIDSHVDGTLSLVVCNTVATAQGIFAEAKKSLPAGMQVILLTSRFRKGDREKHVEVLLNFEKTRKDGKAPDGKGLICVSTQVVEAGVDVSATRLWSEVAPWPSLVQRMGRLNRDGGSNANAQAMFFWDSSAGAKPKKGSRVWAAYLVTTQTPGQSALQFQRQLGLSRYETAFQILHKLRAGMVRPERDTIGGEYPVEVDEAYIGSRSHDMATVGVAVEVRVRKANEDRAAKRAAKHEGGKPLKRLIYAGRLRIRICKERTRTELCKFVQENVTAGSVVRTDACNGYDPLASLGYIHQPTAIKGDHSKTEAHLPLVHLLISNLKTWILGTHHGAIAKRHLQAYLTEFQFRFNRRFYPMTSFHSVLGLAAHAKAPTYDSLYHGEWVHPV